MCISVSMSMSMSLWWVCVRVCICVSVCMCECVYVCMYIYIILYLYCKQTWNTGWLRLNYPVLEGAWRRLSFHTKSIAFSRFILTAHMHALAFRLWHMLTNMCLMPMKSKCRSSCHSSIRAPFSETEGIILRGPKLSLKVWELYCRINLWTRF